MVVKYNVSLEIDIYEDQIASFHRKRFTSAYHI